MRACPNHKRTFLRLAFILALTITSLGLSVAADPTHTVHAAAITVGGGCTLADAINAANTNAPAGGCPAGSGSDTISLTGNVSLTAALPPIITMITINGNGWTISGNNTVRAFYVVAGAGLSLDNVTISSGRVGDVGGAISNSGTLTISNSTISGNTAIIGGGIYNAAGTVILTDSTLSGNTAQFGGGIFSTGGSVAFSRVTFSGNTAYFLGGAIYSSTGTVTGHASMLSGNTALMGGAWYASSGSNNITWSCVLNNTTSTSNQYDVTNLSASAFGAAPNWWGTSSGPGGTALGSGDTVSTNVIYAPFLDAETGLCDPPGAPGATAADHARAQAPLCSDLNGKTNPIVRADIPGGTVPNGGVYCRIINENGSYQALSNPAEIGNAAVISRGVLQAVDVFGQAGTTPVPRFIYSVRVCLQGSGAFLFLNALTMPRTLSELPATVENGYTCATLPNAGTVVLVSGAPASTAPAVGTPLSGCMVTTNYLLNLRENPAQTAAVIVQVPFDVTLTATERLGDWFHVDYLGTAGWLHAAYVAPQGSCG